MYYFVFVTTNPKTTYVWYKIVVFQYSVSLHSLSARNKDQKLVQEIWLNKMDFCWPNAENGCQWPTVTSSTAVCLPIKDHY